MVVRTAAFFFFSALFVFLTSCSKSRSIPISLSEDEQNLIASVNAYRVMQGKPALKSDGGLVNLAREDAARRVATGGGYVDNRQKTGFERMLTLAGKARPGAEFGEKLMDSWQSNELQKSWLNGNYAGVGVGVVEGDSGMQTGVLLLGGFSDGGI